MRSVAAPADLASAVRAARSEAATSFGDASIYLERQLIAAAAHRDPAAGGSPRDRGCVCRARMFDPAPPSEGCRGVAVLAVTAAQREGLAGAAEAIARGVGYTNAGTIEFLLDEDGQFYFLEMNTRLQVEHPVTEMVTGLDLVHWQIRIARGERLDITDRAPSRAGTPSNAASTPRIPICSFMPSPGRITSLRSPAGPGIREDSGVEAGFAIPIHYDSMIAKLIAWAPDRRTAIARLSRALANTRSAASRPRCRSSGGCSDSQTSRRALRHHLSGPAARGPSRNGLLSSTPAADELATIAAAVHAFERATAPAPPRFHSHRERLETRSPRRRTTR